MANEDEKIFNESDIYAVRCEKLKALRESGYNPFTQNCQQEESSQEAIAQFKEGEEAQPTVSVAGRIVVFRLMGKASFIKLLDRAGKIQVYVARDHVGEEVYNRFKKLDLGDIVGVTGELFKTKTGEITVRAHSLTLVSKCLRALPDKWHGLADNDRIYRQRYLDLIMNDESRKRAKMRCHIVRAIREFLWSQQFEEVETPILQNIAGGAAARPFETHMNALDQTCYLRIASELFLKRMLVGTFERVFEIGRMFRNEGVDRKHSPEFTTLEVYQAYTDYRGMMKLIHDMILYICDHVLGHRVVTLFDGTEVDFDKPWAERKYVDLVIEATGDPDWFSFSKEKKLQRCQELGIEVNPENEDFEVTNNVYSKLVEPTLIQPTFVTQLPKELCPLAKLNPDDPRYLDVFELCINGQEIAPAYSEQNDPCVQREMFEKQVGEDIQNLDNEFLTALEYGMPPAGGMGLGIDRLVILLTGASGIRDTILYPLLKVQAQ